MGSKTEQFDVFLSYSRNDTEGWCALLHSELKRQLGPQQWTVFKDNVNTQPGQQHWSKRLENLVDTCRVFIVVIGEDWHSPRVEHLFDENNWVRREILRALAANNKAIIPLILNGRKVPALSGLPVEIQPLLSEWQASFISGDSEKLATEVAVLAQKITGSKVYKVSSDRRLDQAISPLDRHKEADHIASAYRDNNTRVFAFAGDYKDCYESFLHRCQAELGKQNQISGSSAAVEIQGLDWRAFSDLPSESSRTNKLLEQVCDSLSLAKDKSQLQKYFDNNRQAMVFYSVCDKPLSVEVCISWLTYWKALLERNSQQSAIAVLVFNRGWTFRRHCDEIHNAADLAELQLMTEGLGRIEQAHVDEFYKAYLDHVPSDRFRAVVAKSYRWSAFAKVLPQLQPSCRKIRTVLAPLIL